MASSSSTPEAGEVDENVDSRSKSIKGASEAIIGDQVRPTDDATAPTKEAAAQAAAQAQAAEKISN